MAFRFRLGIDKQERAQTLKRLFQFFFASLLLGLAFFQLFRGPYYGALSRNNTIRLLPIRAPRGSLFDRNGIPLAEDRSAFHLSVLPTQSAQLEWILQRLSELLRVDVNTLRTNYRRNYLAPSIPVPVLKDIGKEQAILLQERRDLPSVLIEVEPRRFYPLGPAASHLVGYLEEIDRGGLERLQPYGYHPRDLVGKTGVEEAFDVYLRGRDGGIQLKVNSRGSRVGVLGSKRAIKGKELTLTVDARLQEFIWSLLSQRKGAVAVMDPRDGAILALVSSPSFDPNLLIPPRRLPSEVLRDPDRPLLNRVIQGLYPPGSVLKVAGASVALERHKITSGDYFTCPGFFQLGKARFNCWKEGGHGAVNVTGGLRYSCNVFFFNTGLRVGPDLLAETFRQFGFGESPIRELPYAARGLVPHPLWKRFVRGERWYDGDTLNTAIGQGSILVSPLQILRMMSAAATEGRLVLPYLVQKIETLEVHAERTQYLRFSPQTFSTVRQGLWEVVNEPDGTGRLASVPGLAVAGKTGTAQVEGKEAHAWFSGFAPFQNPRAVLVVFLEHGGRGGMVPAELARQIFQKMQELNLL